MPIQGASRKAMKVIYTQRVHDIVAYGNSDICALRKSSDIATLLQLRVGHPHPNEHSLRAFL